MSPLYMHVVCALCVWRGGGGSMCLHARLCVHIYTSITNYDLLAMVAKFFLKNHKHSPITHPYTSIAYEKVLMRRQLSCRSPQIIPGTKKLTCPSWNVASGQVGQFHRRPGFSPPSCISQDHYQFCGSPNVSRLTHTYLCNFPAKLAHARADPNPVPRSGTESSVGQKWSGRRNFQSPWSLLPEKKNPLQNGVTKYCNLIGQCLDSKSRRILSGYLESSLLT